MHDCKRYLVETVNTMFFNKVGHKVLICEDCKKYYIKRLNGFLGVQYDRLNDKWVKTGEDIE